MNETISLNIWDTKYNEKSIYLNTIEELLNYLDSENTTSYDIYDTHHPEDPIKLLLDKASKNQNITITYTDQEHPITIIDFDFLGKEIIINPSFYDKHKEKIIEYSKKKLQKDIQSKKAIIYIPNNIVTDELIDQITSQEELINTSFVILNITNRDLTTEQINKIKNAHLEVTFNGKTISTNKLIDYYTIKDLKKLTDLTIYPNIPEEQVENFIYLNDNCNIKISSLLKKDEKEYINKLKKIINILSKHNKTYKIKIDIENRKLLKQSGILNTPNIRFTIFNDLYDYTEEEYLTEEEILDKLVEPIKNSNLSPYEKYIAVYNIVKNFKPYKENEDDKNQSRYLRYILNNDYMVCVGYAKLLKTLLDKVEIPCTIISAGVDISYDDGFTLEEKTTEIAGHERNIIKIDDPKYNIHGIYIADATWDNDTEYDLYNNISITFNKKKEAKRLEKLQTEDLLLDFQNFDDFCIKINYYLKTEIAQSHYKDYQDKVTRAYYKIYSGIMTLLSSLDYPKYKELTSKYNKLIEDNRENFLASEQIYSNFLTDYALYIIPLSNKEIDSTTLLEAAINTKKELHNYNKEKLEELKNLLTSYHEQFDSMAFPYVYDPNNKTEGYLESKQSKSK